jgi:hypothetical protein
MVPRSRRRWPFSGPSLDVNAREEEIRVSRGLGKLQRAILEALPAHELAKHPGVYDLKRLRTALFQAMGRGYYVRGKYSQERNIWWVDSAFAACFSRAVKSLIHRGLLTTWREPSAWVVFDVPDGGRWRLPYVHRTDKR